MDSSFDLSAGIARNGRALSVESDGVEVWGWKRPLLGAVGCLGNALSGAIEIGFGIAMPVQAVRQRDAVVEIRGTAMTGWKRPFGVAAITLGLIAHGLFSVVAGIVSAPLALIAGAAGSLGHAAASVAGRGAPAETPYERAFREFAEGEALPDPIQTRHVEVPGPMMAPVKATPAAPQRAAPAVDRELG